jgi:hypothetical protein
MRTLIDLEGQLRGMRRDTADYALMRDHDPLQLIEMRKECAALWGAIECFKKGTMSVLASHAKYLQ